MSPSAASGKRETVTASWKALTIQIALSGATANWRPMVGSATVTMVPSSTAMLIAMARVKKASRRCGLASPSCTSTARGGDIGSGRFKAAYGSCAYDVYGARFRWTRRVEACSPQKHERLTLDETLPG